MDIDALTSKYTGAAVPGATPARGVKPPDIDVDYLTNKYARELDAPTEASVSEGVMPAVRSFNQFNKNLGAGTIRGVLDVTDTVGKGIGFIDRNLIPGGEARSAAFNERAKAEQEQFDQNAADSPVASTIGRVAGQAAATAPFVPARAVQAAKGIVGALPTITAAGEKIAAPIFNRLAGVVAEGGIAGSTAGALTSGSNENGLIQNTAEGAAFGALGAPIARLATKGAGAIVHGAQNLWTNLKVNQAVKDSGIAPHVAKSVIDSLDNAGYSVDEAIAEFKRLGPKATLADIDPMLTKEARGIAQTGGKATSVLNNTFNERAALANDDALQMIEAKLGPKINLKAEQDAIVNQARQSTSTDYQLAHKSTTPVDASKVVSDIDSALETAVGPKTAKLAEIKSYLFKDATDPTTGEVTKVLKNDVKSLHEVRIALDDMLDRLPIEGTTQKSSIYRAVSDARAGVDEALKTNPHMQHADEIFAKKMEIKNSLQKGYDWQKGNFDDFERMYNKATPEGKEALKKGMKANIDDLLDKGEQGELSALQRAFGKKSLNRKKLELAYGNDAQEALDELQKRIAFRATERGVTQGSDTAFNRLMQNKYGGAEDSGNLLSNVVKGATLDLATGSPAIATGIGAARAIGSGLRARKINMNVDNFAQGSADIFSRQGQARDNAMTVFKTVEKIQKTQPKNRELRLPATFSVPVGQEIYDQGIKIKNRLFGE